MVLKNGSSTFLALLVSAIAGLATMIIIALIFMWMFRLQSDGTMNIKNALGVSAGFISHTCIKTGQRQGKRYDSGKYTELAAVTDEDTPIQFGKKSWL